MFSFVGTLRTYMEQPISSASVLSVSLRRDTPCVVQLLTRCCGPLPCGQMI